MGLPAKRRTSRSRRERARHHGVKGITLSTDADGNLHRPHHAAPTTGKYRGRMVVDVKKRINRAQKKG